MYPFICIFTYARSNIVHVYFSVLIYVYKNSNKGLSHVLCGYITNYHLLSGIVFKVEKQQQKRRSEAALMVTLSYVAIAQSS